MTATPAIVRASGREALLRLVEVSNETSPRYLSSVDEFALADEMLPDRAHWSALLGDETVAAAFASSRLIAPETDIGIAWIGVRSPYRRAGLGRALWEQARAHLIECGKTAAEVQIHGDEPDALAFAARRGFVEVTRNQTVALDLASFTPARTALPDGVVLTNLTERPDLLEQLWRLTALVTADIPGPEGDEFDVTLEAFGQILAPPWVDGRLIVLALHGEELIGSATLVPQPADPTTAWHWMTGVRKDWRGQRLSSALKDAQLTAAKAAGVRLVRTINELRNAPIRRLNERLGYRREPDLVGLRATL